MRRRRFCSACGEPIKTNDLGLPLIIRQLCARCSPQFRRERLLLAAAFVLCLSSVFAIARYTSETQPAYFVGQPVKSNADSLTASTSESSSRANAGSARVEAAQISPESRRSLESICGAQTKSGKPCQRRVKDGGYCWQHRPKPAPNNRTAERR